MTYPTLILLPGMDGTGLLFEPFLAALGGEFDVEVVRYPADKPLNYAELEVIARAAIPPDGPVILLGESFSGPIAVSLAASMGSRVAGLLLCCSFVRNPLPALSGLRGLVDALPVARIPVRLLSYFLLGKFSSSAQRAALAAALSGVIPEVMRERMRAALSVDVSAKLGQLKIPLLYMQATRDRVVPHTAADLVMTLAPHTRKFEFDAPHLLLQTVPQEAVRVVVDFVHARNDA